MTVRELILALSKKPPEQEVRLEVCDAGPTGAHLYRIATVKRASNDKQEVWIRARIGDPEWIP